MSVLVLSLDAADPTLVRRLATDGEMPAMARLLREGAAVDTLAPEGVFVSANWPTLFTATLPDRHRYLCWEQIPGGAYHRVFTDPRWIEGAPLWRRLSEAGKRVAVIDVPHTYVEPLNGVMVSEWGCHDRHLGPASWPPELVDELGERHGSHLGTAPSDRWEQFAPCDWIHRAAQDERTEAESVALIEEIRASLERKRRGSLELLDQGGWDFYMNVFGESHCTGHQFWHLHDPAHYRYDARLAAAVGGNPVVEIYRRLDGVIADHLERVGPDDTVYVTLAHGMTAHHDGTHLLEHLLHRLDWGLDAPSGLGGASRAAGAATGWMPGSARRRALRGLAPLLRRHGGTAALEDLPPIHRRRWFLTPNNTVVGAVRLNLAGREPHGRILPEDRREVLEWLSERMLELVNVETGGPVVRRCVITDDVYRRSAEDSFGDLFLEWDRRAPIERVWSPSVGTVARPYGEWRQGDHIREGLTVARGPGIRPGRIRAVHGVADLGATYAAATGVALDGVDGQPIPGLLPTGAAPAPSPRQGRRTPAWAKRPEPLPDAGNEERSRAELTRLASRVADLERSVQVAAGTAWHAHAPAVPSALVSVVTPTRDRRARLAEAIASVEAQTYSRWELLVIDDGSADDTASYLAALDDPRVRALTSGGVGACAARNVALAAARGDLVVYLDDDNRFDPGWLAAVVAAFEGRPDAVFGYGARVADDSGRVHGREATGVPWLQFEAWDAEAIRRHNLADTNVLAHRRNGIRFDESLSFLGDWDLVLRLAAAGPPLEIPSIAAYYRTDAPGRITSAIGPGELERELSVVRAKLEAA